MTVNTEFAMPWEEKPAFDPADAKSKLADLNWYRPRFLKVRPKASGPRIPFIVNPAQVRLDALMDAEKKKFGRIRCLIPKARQMGVSTYIGGRNFHRVATGHGQRALVMAHRSDSATNLHREIKEFYEGLPPALKPVLGLSNSREVIFPVLKSLYKVASAESSDVGRGDTFQLLHGSEVAFFDNTDDLSSGLLQTVPEMDGTEIAFESTGNGQSGLFFNMCEQAVRDQNKGEWRCHFLPWYIMPEYQEAAPQGWKAPSEFEEYGRLHSLSRDQLYWFWKKNYTTATMNGGQPETVHRLQRQEYPATYAECFMADSTLDFFPASIVAAAMAAKPMPSAGAPKLLCVDPAGDGQDAAFVCDRQGTAIGARVWGELKNRDYNVQADWLVQTFDRFEMDAIVLDGTGGYGKGLADALRLRMRHRGPDKVISVVFSHGARNSVRYGNRRAEIHDKLHHWLQGSVSVPNDKELQEELAAYKWGVGGARRDEKGRLFMTPKEKIRQDLGRSPAKSDVCAIAMAVEL